MTVVNLLAPANARGFADFSDHTWTSISNATLRRTSREAHRGGSSLLFTSTAATSAVRSNSPTNEHLAVVTAGEQYRGILWFKHATSGRQVRFGIEFWDAAGNVLDTTKSIATIQQGDPLASPSPLSSTTVVVTTTSAHELNSGDLVSISGTGISGLNLSNVEVTVISPTQFQVESTSASLGPATTGTVSIPGFRSSIFRMGYEDWTLASRISLAPSNAVFAALRVEMTGVDTASITDPFLYLDSPAIVDVAFQASTFMSRLGQRIPDYIKRSDGEQTNPQNPLYRFIDLMGFQGQEIIRYIVEFNYRSPVDGGELGETSSLVDPSDYPNSPTKPEWLYWMAQHFGIRAVTVPGGFTSWAALAAYATWNQWEDDIISGAPPAPQAISSKTRTNGVVTVVTSAANTFGIGDSVEVSASPRSTFDGIYEVSGYTDSTTFAYSQVKNILAISRSGNTVSVTTGLAHYYEVGDSVVIAGTGNSTLNGTFTVASIVSPGNDDLPNVFTYTTGTSGTIGSIYNTGTTYPANATSSGGTVGLTSDLYWEGIEQFNPNSIPTDEALAYLIRTGATGIWAGTVAGIQMAARLPLSGVDLKANIVAIAGTATVTTETAHGLAAGNDIEIYGTHEERLDRRYQINTVTSPTTFTILVGPESLSLSGWVTNKIVDVTRGFWTAPPSTLVANGTTITITFTRKIPFFATAAPIYISGTSGFNGTYNPASVTVSNDRFSISFANAMGAASETPSGALVRLVGNQFTYVVKTLQSQTGNTNSVVAFAEQAKPSGGVITHEYI